jgi:hypothetical protein
VQRPVWILGLGLALLGASAAAVPCGDDSCQEQEDRNDPSIKLTPTQPRGPSDDASRTPGHQPSHDLRKKIQRPPEFRDDGQAREWRKRIAAMPGIPVMRLAS